MQRLYELVLLPTKVMKKTEKVGLWSKKSEKVVFLQRRLERADKAIGELSSVGLEHRPYKAGVVGSSPTVPTKKSELPKAVPIFLVES